MGTPGAPDTNLDAHGLRFGIVASRFNADVVERLADGAQDMLTRHRAQAQDIRVVWVPGAFEVPLVLARLAASGSVDGLVALGCVVRGDTPHFDYVAGECAAGASRVALDFGVPVGFGVLTTDTWEQAIERAGGQLGNKGAEAALTAIEMVRVLKEL